MKILAIISLALLAVSSHAQRLISVGTTTNGVVSVPYTFWPSNAASAWTAWGMTQTGLAFHLGDGRFMPLGIGTGLSTNGGLLSATNGSVANIGTNDAVSGSPVVFQPDLSFATTNTLTVSTQVVDVLELTTPLSIADGGTGTNSAVAALSNLGGQPLDSDLTLLSSIGLSTNGWIRGYALAFQIDGSLAPTNIVSGGTGTNTSYVGGPVDFLDFRKPDDSFVRISFDDLNNMNLTTGDGSSGGGSVSWTNLIDVPAGFADGTDDGAGGGSGTVTNVALELPVDVFIVTGSPITDGGTLSATFTNQSANTVFAGPIVGVPAPPAFRALAEDDIPASIARDAEVALAYQPVDADLTSLAAGTAIATAITNSVSVGAPIIIAGTTNIAADLATKLTQASASALYQGTNANLTTVASLTSGTATNFLAGDGTFKQVTTNMVPGLVGDLSNLSTYAGTHLTESEASALYQATNANLTLLSTNNASSLTNLNASNLASGTVPDARLSPAVALTNSPTIHSPTFQGTVTVSGTNALVLGGEARTNWPTGGTWDGTAIASGTITNLTTETATTSTASAGDNDTTVATTAFVQLSRTNAPMPGRYDYYRYTDFDIPENATGANYALPWGGVALSSGSIGQLYVSNPSNDPSGARTTSSSSVNGGYLLQLYRIGFLLNSNAFTEFTFRPQATNNTVIISRIGWMDNQTVAAACADGLYMERNGMDVTLVARSNSVSTTSVNSYQISSNALYTGRIDVRNVSGSLAADLRLWDASQDPPELLTTLSVTNGIPNGSGTYTGHGYIAWSTNNVNVNLDDLLFMNVYQPRSR